MKGIYFDEVHSYKDLNLILSSVSIPPATAKTNYIDIPGADGSIDLTEAHGTVRYKNRNCSFVFSVFPYEDFEEKKKQISNLLNGRRCKIKLDKDDDYYWLGRCSVNNYASNKNLHKITVNATVEPYKYKVEETAVDVSLNGSTAVQVILTNGRKAVCPTITCSNDNTLFTVGVLEFTLSKGTHKVLDFQLQEGETTVSIKGTGTVNIKYREGDL